MSEVTLFGFPRSTYVQIAGLVLTHKDVPYRFHDLESEMGGPSHLALHPFDRVPILRHGDFTLYETAAITSYVAPPNNIGLGIAGSPAEAARFQALRLLTLVLRP